MIVHLGDVREPLSDRSIAVLYRFVRWPMDVEDSFKNEKPFTEEEIEQMKSLGPRGLGELMDELGQIRKGKGHTKT